MSIELIYDLHDIKQAYKLPMTASRDQSRPDERIHQVRDHVRVLEFCDLVVGTHEVHLTINLLPTHEGL